MHMLIIFDCDADIIDVPEEIVMKRLSIRKEFLKWIYNKKSKHKYWEKYVRSSGEEVLCLNYRSDALVEWLNRYKLKSHQEQASIIKQYVSAETDALPRIEF